MPIAGRQGCWALICAFCFCSAARAQSDAETLQRAQQLAWEKQFAAAEKLYHEVLQRSPESHNAAFGLGQVTLWQGRYREARRLFTAMSQRNPADIDAAEGAATAAYWQGDYRTAEREFAAIAATHPERQTSVKSLAEIRSASRGDTRLALDGIRDDQPYRAWRSSATVSSFSDPLTRWDVAAGAYHLDSPVRRVTRTEPFVSIANETVLPWQRLTITTMAGALRWPDGVTRPIGSVTFTHRLSANASVAVVGEHRELLTNSTSVGTHPALTRFAAAWSRFADHSWLAGVEAGRNRYFDGNRGGYIQGYALWPIARNDRTTMWIGASAAARDTRDTRFELDAISSTRLSAGNFAYRYRGSYRDYWTPIDFREARAIVTIAHTFGKNVQLKAQGERGVGRDEVRGFGPASNSAPLPSIVYAFDFNRTSHPYRISAGLSLPIASGMRMECGVERNVTSFYAANGFRASLVRNR